MRAIVTLVASVALALVAGACTKSISDTDYAREGIGVELSRSALPAQTEMQNLYLVSLCQQTSATLSGPIECDHVGPTQWPLIVQAGMNDIDLRCDAYLTWIDNVRRSSTAILSEITDVGTATEAIMGVTGVGTKQMAIVAAAFGLAYNSFTNVSHRLLLDVDKTTVQSVVYRRRIDYRNDLAKVGPVSNRPAAIHALRQYLSICLPITIETDINATVTTFQQTGETGGGLTDVGTVRSANTATRAPSAPVVASLPVQQFSRPVPVGPPNAAGAAFFVGYKPEVQGTAYVDMILRKVCVPKADLSKASPKTTARIQAFQQYLYSSLTNKDGKVTGMLTTVEAGRLANAPDCAGDKFANYYEEQETPNGINDKWVVDLLNKVLPAGQKLGATPSVNDVRARIPAVRASSVGTNLLLNGKDFSDQLTLDLMTALSNIP
jgi:hypothetical protein